MPATAESPAPSTSPTEPTHYVVHPAASLFPLMEGDAFNELVESVRQHGIRQPVVIHDGVLVDGRNRLRAVEQLKAEGIDVAVPTVALASLIDDVTTVTDWIYSTNKIRRHMTPDQLAIVAAEMMPLIQAEATERKKATQFQKGKSGNPEGKKQASTKRSTPAKRDTKARDAASTAGQVAAKAGVSLRKAKQACAITKGVQDGTVSEDDARAVRDGTKTLRAVAPKRKKRDAAPKAVVPLTLEEEVARAWERFMTKNNFAIADRSEVRRIVKRLIAAEEKAIA